MFAHFQVINSKVKGRDHFGKNFKQNLEYYTELAAVFMDFSETSHSDSLRDPQHVSNKFKRAYYALGGALVAIAQHYSQPPTKLT